MDKPDLQSPTDDNNAAKGTAPDATPDATPGAQEQPRADAFGNTASTGSDDAGVFPQLDTEDSRNALAPRPEAGGAGINAMLNVGLDVQIVLGQARMPIAPAGTHPRLHRRAEPQNRRAGRPHGL